MIPNPFALLNPTWVIVCTTAAVFLSGLGTGIVVG